MAKKEEEKKSVFIRIIKNRFVISLLLMVVIGGAALGLVLLGLNLYTKHGESVSVPSLSGVQVEEAASLLKKSSLNYEVVDSVFLTDGTPGAIIEQVPEGGSNVKKGRTVYLTMQAKSVEMVEIPELKDFSLRQAVASLNSLGFKDIKVNEVPSPYRGLVMEASSKGVAIEAKGKVAKGAPIVLTVGAGGQVLIDSIIDIIPDLESGPDVDHSFFE